MRKNRDLIQSYRGSSMVCLNRNNIDDDDLHFLVLNGTNKKVAKLLLGGNDIGWVGVSYLCEARWNKLSHLNLSNINTIGVWDQKFNRIGDMGCRWLTRIQAPGMTCIQLGLNSISQFGIAHLSKVSFRLLEQLEISLNDLSGRETIKLTKMCCSLVELLLGTLSSMKQIQGQVIKHSCICFRLNGPVFSIQAYVLVIQAALPHYIKNRSFKRLLLDLWPKTDYYAINY